MHDKTIRRRRAVLALLVAGSVVLLTASFGGAGGFLGSVQRGVLEVVSPIQGGASRALKPVRDLFGWVGDTWEAQGENDDLREDVDALRAQNARLARDARQAEQYRRLLALDAELGLDEMGPVVARVNGTSPTVWYRRAVINKGSADGLKTDQPVVNGSGLVGRIAAVSPHAATVTLLTDATFGAGARTSTGITGTIAAAVGQPGRLILEGTDSRDRVDVGQQVVTAGTDEQRYASLFPPDVPVGQVVRVDEAGSDAQKVYVRPYVNPRRLDQVQVLTRRVDGNR